MIQFCVFFIFLQDSLRSPLRQISIFLRDSLRSPLRQISIFIRSYLRDFPTSLPSVASPANFENLKNYTYSSSRNSFVHPKYASPLSTGVDTTHSSEICSIGIPTTLRPRGFAISRTIFIFSSG